MNTLDFITIILFSIGVLITGVSFSRTGKDMKSFFAGGGDVPWGMSGLSLFMGFFSAGTFVVWGSIAYSYGIVAIVIQLTMAVAGFAVGTWIAPRWHRTRSLTAAEYITERFGVGTQKTYTYIFLAVSIFTTGSFLYPVAKIVEVAAGIPLTTSILALGAFSMIYVAVGGLRGVVVTDVLQFVILFAALIIVIPLSFGKIDGVRTLFEQAPDGFFRLFQGEYTPGFIFAFCVYNMFFLGGNWAYVQRYTSVKTEKDSKKVGWLFGALYLVSPILWMLPPMIYRIFNPNLVGLQNEDAYLLMCKEAMPGGMLGLMLGGMIFATASSLNSTLNISAGVFTNDIFRRLRPDSSEKTLMRVARISTLGFGVLAVVVALLIKSMGGIVNVVISVAALTGVPIYLPVIWSLFSKRQTSKTILGVTFISLAINLFFKFVTPLFGLSLDRTWEMIVGAIVPVIMLAVIEIVLWRKNWHDPKYDGYIQARNARIAGNAVSSDPEARKQTDRFTKKVLGTALAISGAIIAVLGFMAGKDAAAPVAVGAIICLLGCIMLIKSRAAAVSCLALLLTFSANTANAANAASAANVSDQQQKRTISGMVIDFETGEPIIGAYIAVPQKNTGAISDLEGYFTLELAAEDRTVEISYVGYKTQKLELKNEKELTIRLQKDAELLDEVVVVGYGTTTRKDLTGAVGKADVEEMVKAPVANFEEMLAGRVAGVQVTSADGQPGSDLNIVIRGNNSVTQDNSPLYVVDGFPMESSVGSTMINPEEIESIDILKDASATAIYGARGANGVVLITTKKGHVGAPVVTYNGWVGVQTVSNRMEMMSPYEFVQYQLELNPGVYDGVYFGTNGERDLEYYRNVKGIDWQDLLFRDALVHNHNISVRGGNEKTRYSVSGSINDQDGVILNSGYQKYQGRVVLDQTINKRLKIGVNLNYTYTKKYGTVVAEFDTSPTASLMYSIWGYRPISGINEGNLMDSLFDETTDPNSDYRINPYQSAMNEYNPLHTHNFIANAYIDYKILKNLTLRVTGGLNKIHQRREVFFNSSSRGGHMYTNNKVNGSLTNIERTNFVNENTLTYTPKLGKGHNLKALAGFTIQESKYMSSAIYSINIPNESLGIAGLDQGELTEAPITKTSNTLMSYLARVEYNWKSRYLVTASFRADGSSKFSPENRWAYFPSASVAWAFAEENFMKGLRWWNTGKLRLGYGTTGNNRVSDYAYLSSMEIDPDSGYAFGNIPDKGVVPDLLGNKDLKWETTMQANAGLDLGFFNDRLLITLDYYYKRTKDLLLNATLAPSMGYLQAYKNVGSVSNSGFEITIDTRNIETKDFLWTSSFNISFNRNKVLALNDDEPSLATRINWGNYGNAYPYIAIPGLPIAMYYGYLFDGIYQYDDFDKVGDTYILKDGIPNNGDARESIQPGDIRYKDINGDGEVNSYDQTIIGNPNPDHIGGFNNYFQYKNLDLSIYFQWSYGGEVMNANRIVFEAGEPVSRQSLNMFASYADRWTPENPSNTLYRVGGQGPAVYSDRTIEDGSFLRLKTVSIGYRFPSKWMKKAKIRSLRVYVSGQNLFTWTKYSGMDPEVSTRSSALTPSFDWSAYPRARTITGGIELSF